MGQSFGGVDFTGFGVEIIQVFFLGFDLENFRTSETLAVDSSGLRQF